MRRIHFNLWSNAFLVFYTLVHFWFSIYSLFVQYGFWLEAQAHFNSATSTAFHSNIYPVSYMFLSSIKQAYFTMSTQWNPASAVFVQTEWATVIYSLFHWECYIIGTHTNTHLTKHQIKRIASECWYSWISKEVAMQKVVEPQLPSLRIIKSKPFRSICRNFSSHHSTIHSSCSTFKLLFIFLECVFVFHSYRAPAQSTSYSNIKSSITFKAQIFHLRIAENAFHHRYNWMSDEIRAK